MGNASKKPKRFSVDDVLDAGACYTRKELEDLWAGRKRISVRTMMDFDIPVVDRVWCLAHLRESKWTSTTRWRRR